MDPLFMSVEKIDDTSQCVLGDGDATLKIIVKSDVVTCLSGGPRNADNRIPEMNVASVHAL